MMTDALTCYGCATMRDDCEHDPELEIASAVAELAEAAERLAGLAKLYEAPDSEVILTHTILTAIDGYRKEKRRQ